MKTINFILLSLLVNTLAHAQSVMEKDIDEERTKLEDQLTKQAEAIKDYKKRWEDDLKKIEAKKEELRALEHYEENFAQNRIVALSEINDSIKNVPFLQKLGSKVSYFKCLKSSLEKNQTLNQKSCLSWHSPTLNDDDLAMVKKWENSVGLSLKDAALKREVLPKEISHLETMSTTWERNYNYAIQGEERFKQELKILENSKEDYTVLKSHSNVANCDENTPTVNLEEEVPFPGAKFKGAYFGVPRDNQDGLGTCYANAAKNLLVGASGGEAVASFLDLALVYKNENGSVTTSGLDGGLSCATLNAAKKTGYCPQRYAPLEGGEVNIAAESLFNVDKWTYLATNVDFIRKFLGELDLFEQSSSLSKEEILARAKTISEKIKNNPDVTLPVPIARFEIPERWKLEEGLHLSAPKTKSVAEHLKEYDEAYAVFFPKYVKAVMEGKNADQIFDLWKADLTPYLTKNNLLSNLDVYKRIFKTNTQSDYQDPKLKQKIRASVDFMKDLMNKNDMSDEDFFAFCAAEGDSLKFLSSLQPLMEKIKSNKLNADNLFDKDGKFRSYKDLMQLTVAPSCLNEENRKPLPAFSCNEGYGTITKLRGKGKTAEEQNKLIRERVVINLVQGYGVGNSFQTSGGGHINTIVGIRFNKERNRCEVLIRESQNGRSEWWDEKPIFERMKALAEVRKDK